MRTQRRLATSSGVSQEVGASAEKRLECGESGPETAEDQRRWACIRPLSRVPSLLRNLKHQLCGRPIIGDTGVQFAWQVVDGRADERHPEARRLHHPGPGRRLRKTTRYPLS